MDDAEYRRLISAPDVMKRADLRATESRLVGEAPDLVEAIRRVLRSAPVRRPPAHTGLPDDDYLWLDLSEDEIDAIHEALRDQERELASDEKPDHIRLAWVADLADRWNSAESSRPGD